MSEQEKRVYEAARDYVDACQRGKSMVDRDILERELLRLIKQHLE